MKKVILELTPEQAESVKVATELLMRVGIGQFEHIVELMDAGLIVPRNPNGLEPDTICDCRDLLKKASHLSDCSNFGIGNPALNKTIQRSYEVSKVLSGALSEHNNVPQSALTWRPLEHEPLPVVKIDS